MTASPIAAPAPVSAPAPVPAPVQYQPAPAPSYSERTTRAEAQSDGGRTGRHAFGMVVFLLSYAVAAGVGAVGPQAAPDSSFCGGSYASNFIPLVGPIIATAAADSSSYPLYEYRDGRRVLVDRAPCLSSAYVGASWTYAITDSVLQIAGLAGFLFLPRWHARASLNANAQRFPRPVAMGVLPAISGTQLGLSFVATF